RDYFDDLWLVHEALELGDERDGARVFASLAPVKESEVVIVGRPGDDERSLAGAIAHVVAAYRSRGVVSYNLALLLPPLSADGNDWRRFPPQARLVDRGDTANKTSDIGGWSSMPRRSSPATPSGSRRSSAPRSAQMTVG